MIKIRKGFVPGLNGQVVVTEPQIIVAENVTPEKNHKQQLHPMLEPTEVNRPAVGIKEKTGLALADGRWEMVDIVVKIISPRHRQVRLNC